MKLFVDTNILIDIIANRKPWVEDALILLELSRQRKVELITADFSLLNIAYIVRKMFALPDICLLLNDLKKYLHIVEMGDDVLSHALTAGWPDLEDCVQSLIASREKAEFIITRNEKDFLLSDVAVLSPQQFLEKFL